MPNPLVRPGPGRPQSTEPPTREVPPEPEHHAGWSAPYRGDEPHGVMPTEEFHGPVADHPDGTVHVEFTKPPAEPEPIPVRVVSSGGRELRQWDVSVTPIVDNVPHQIFGRDETRTKATIRNDGPDDLFIAPEPGRASSAFGWRIPANDKLDVTAETNVWASSSLASTGSVVRVYREWATKE